MKHSITLLATAFSLCLASSVAQAEWRCDCTTIVDNCSATVTVRDAWVDVTSSSRQCARVDYFIDGAPFVALVVDGEARQDWLARSADPDILIQSCQVCLDRSTDAVPAAPQPGTGALVPVIEVAPEYPPAAAAEGIEGFAEISFTVTPFGTIEDAAVTAAQPSGVFDAAALTAIARWRYAIDEDRAPAALNHRFTFELDQALMALTEPRAEPLIARQPADQRSQCIREQASYDYGEMVEVSLMNVCADPVIVYSCAEGTGRLQGQWVCASSERTNEALVRPGDVRVGSVAATGAAGGGALRYAEQLFIARAPNTQYWWLACAVENEDCRSTGRQWLRATDRQLASVDPQGRSARPLARAN